MICCSSAAMTLLSVIPKTLPVKLSFSCRIAGLIYAHDAENSISLLAVSFPSALIVSFSSTIDVVPMFGVIVTCASVITVANPNAIVKNSRTRFLVGSCCDHTLCCLNIEAYDMIKFVGRN